MIKKKMTIARKKVVNLPKTLVHVPTGVTSLSSLITRGSDIL